MSKSWTAARLALWFGACFRSKVITTAPGIKQVRGIIWAEIPMAHRKAAARGMPLGGRVLTQQIQWDPDWWIWGMTSRDYDKDAFQGYHAPRVLVIVDEAAGVSKEIMDGVSSLISTQGAHALYIGNPTDPNSEFARKFEQPDVAKIRISAYDTPNFTHYGIREAHIADGSWRDKITGPLPRPYLITPEWVAARYNPTDPYYVARILAEFPDVSPDTLIPLSWITAAQERDLEPGAPDVLGVDIARFGSDETVLYRRRGPHARLYLSARGLATTETAGRVKTALEDLPSASANLDVIGVGAGVYDQCKSWGLSVVPVNVGEKARNAEKFANQRAEYFWALRERFEAGEIDLDPSDEDLASQLATLRYKYRPGGQILIESKEEAKRRGVRSPDRADALMLAYAPAANRRPAIV